MITAFFAVALIPAHAYAACSPGIPCTGYTVGSNPTANTDAAFNGPKSGAPAPYDETACDANFMNQIYSRAFMEANREVIMSQQLINKPDSVLEYTCFDQHVSMVARQAGPIFSESQDWRNRVIEIWTAGTDSTYGGTAGSRTTTIINTPNVNIWPDQTSYSVFEDDRLDNILEASLFDTLQDYIDGNFAHTLLGEATTIDNSIDTSAIGANYNCSHMSTLWNIAKCIDFGEDDRFRSFATLVSQDPRSIPLACSPSAIANDSIRAGIDTTKVDTAATGTPASMPSGGISDPCPAAGGPASSAETGFSDDLIRLSTNCDTGAASNSFASFDPIETYQNLLNGVGEYAAGTGGSASGNITCAPAIPTGVPVITYRISDTNSTAGTGPGGIRVADREPRIHYDHFCPNPGCFYDVTTQAYTLGAPLPATTPTGTCRPLP